MKPIIVTGLKPSGKLHLGNYLGAVKQIIDIQNSEKYECFCFVADYHSLTEKYSPKEKKQEILEVVIDLLSLGVDPQRSVFFIQSHVPEHANLAWIFNNIVSVGKLQGMIEYKEKIQEGQPANAGLFNYPVLMAADILIYKADFVPVGEDQSQHIEITREIARTFNKTFGKTFNEPKIVLSKGLRIKALDNPNKKMSKSLPKGCLFLSDSPEVIRQKIKTAVTDSGKEIVYDPKNKPAISNLLTIYSEVTNKPIQRIAATYKNKGYLKFKSDLAENIIIFLNPFQEKRKKFAASPEKIKKDLAIGSKKAGIIAQNTLKEVKKTIGLI
ncbi:MAG: tryptophan--tRNA ligase [Candidatus Liptonbacteria bacterium]|nr:tryptophan--tRNA ligase [Candidatus Liptonbacteria bacterium]